MAKGMYIGQSGTAAKVKKAYIGVDGVARKVKKAYIGVDNVARLCWSGEPFVLSYNGASTVTTVTHGGITYEQWMLTSSGMLSIVSGEAPAGCKVCVVGGGASGRPQYSDYSAGAGAFLKNQDVMLTGNVAVTIGAGGVNTATGAAGGTSAFGAVQAAGGLAPVQVITSSSPASGTGAGNLGTVAQKGDGISKYPFGDTVNFAGRPHCGGGAAAVHRSASADKTGADGGTNGGNGFTGRAGSLPMGGAYGAGRGGYAATIETGIGGSATFYGSGGGNGFYWWTGSSETSFPGGVGYQGVVYLRVPIS